MDKSDAPLSSPALLTEKLEKLLGLIECMEIDAVWKADVLSQMGETWAKTGVLGADFIFQKALQEIHRIEDDRKIYSISPHDDDDDEGSDKTAFLINFAVDWAQSNPRQAVNLIADVEDVAKRSEGLSQIAAEWVKFDPEQALKLAQSIEHGEDREWALAYIARFWAKSNSTRAAQIAQTLENPVKKARTLCDVAGTCAKTDPPQAGVIFQQALKAAEQVAEDSVPVVKKSVFSRFLASLSSDRPFLTKAPLLKDIAVSWAEIAPEQALGVAERIADDSYKDTALEKVLPLLAKENLQQAVQTVDKMRPRYYNMVSTLVSVAAACAGTEPRQAALLLERALDFTKPSWLDRLLDRFTFDTSEAILRSVVEVYVLLNVERALQIANSGNIKDPERKARILHDAAVALIDMNSQQAFRIFQQSAQAANAIQNDDDRAHFFRYNAEVWAEKIPSQALNLTEIAHNPFDQAIVLNKIAAVLAKPNTTRARAILHLPPSANGLKAYERYYYDKTDAVRDVAAAIAKDDPAGADALFQTVLLLANRISDASRKATALGYLAEAWAATDPQQALQIADSISYEETKVETLYKVAAVWARAVPKQAGQVMEVARRISREYDHHRFKAIYEVANAWTKADFEGVLAHAAETDDMAEREAMINGILLTLSQEAEQLAKSAIAPTS